MSFSDLPGSLSSSLLAWLREIYDRCSKTVIGIFRRSVGGWSVVIPVAVATVDQSTVGYVWYCRVSAGRGSRRGGSKVAKRTRRHATRLYRRLVKIFFSQRRNVEVSMAFGWHATGEFCHFFFFYKSISQMANSWQFSTWETTSKRASPSGTSRDPVPMEKSTADGEENDSEDYSASVCAIMQQRNSTRRQSRRKRRPSSPFGDNVDGVARRRSSVYTTSSGELVFALRELEWNLKFVRFILSEEIVSNWNKVIFLI